MSWPVVALFATSTAFVILLLFYFLKKERYKRSPRPGKGVEFVTAQRAVEAQTLALTPKVMLLVEKEKLMAGWLEWGTLSEEARRRIEELLRDVSSDGFWEKLTGSGDVPILRER